MNVRWFRENLSVLIFGVAFVAILSTLIVFLRDAVAQQDVVQVELSSQKTERDRLRGVTPPLSTATIQTLQSDREIVSRLYQAMQRAAGRNPLSVRDFSSDIDFSLLLRSNITALAETAQAQHVETGPKFSFGFSRYDANLPCHNPSATGEECKKILGLLGKQLAVIEKLSYLLITNKVDQIDAIRRTEVEPGGGADTLNEPISNSPKALYHTYPFELEFECGTDALRNFLNDLSQADCLFIIRTIKISTKMVDSKAPDVTPMPTPATSSTDTMKAIEVQPAQQSHRLTVDLRVDFVEFAPAAAKPPAGRH